MASAGHDLDDVTWNRVVLDDERWDVASQAADAARLTHEGARVGKVDGVDLECAVRRWRLHLVAADATQGLVIFEPLHLMNQYHEAIH